MFFVVHCGVVIDVYGVYWCLLIFIDVYDVFDVYDVYWCLLMFIDVYWYLSLNYVLTSWLFWRSFFSGIKRWQFLLHQPLTPQREASLFRIPLVGLVYSSINQGFIVITRRIRKFMVMAFIFMAYMATGSRKKIS